MPSLQVPGATVEGKLLVRAFRDQRPADISGDAGGEHGEIEACLVAAGRAPGGLGSVRAERPEGFGAEAGERGRQAVVPPPARLGGEVAHRGPSRAFAGVEPTPCAALVEGGHLDLAGVGGEGSDDFGLRARLRPDIEGLAGRDAGDVVEPGERSPAGVGGGREEEEDHERPHPRPCGSGRLPPASLTATKTNFASVTLSGSPRGRASPRPRRR